ncbi:MAG: hypothetical protein LH632_16875 [Rhodoferax sp.]|nr:hypothetical protein [Rhodoferax sp.]
MVVNFVVTGLDFNTAADFAGAIVLAGVFKAALAAGFATVLVFGATAFWATDTTGFLDF